MTKCDVLGIIKFGMVLVGGNFLHNAKSVPNFIVCMENNYEYCKSNKKRRCSTGV